MGGGSMSGPERIWVTGASPGGSWSSSDHTHFPGTPYIRADIHAEVCGYLASCIAMIEHAIGPGRDVFIEPDTGRKLSDARAALAKIGEAG